MPKPAPLIVGLCGSAGAGKSTIAHLVVNHPSLDGEPPAEVLPLAAPLRQALNLMGVYKDKDPSLYRTLAQRIGTDLLRSHNPDHWVDLWRRHFLDLCELSPPTLYPPFVVIDDVRFPNEVALCDLVYVVVRPSRITTLTPEQASHPSEALAAEAIVSQPTLINEEGKADEAADRLLLNIQKWVAARVDQAQAVS